MNELKGKPKETELEKQLVARSSSGTFEATVNTLNDMGSPWKVLSKEGCELYQVWCI